MKFWLGRVFLEKGRNRDGLIGATLSFRNACKIQRQASVAPQSMSGKPSPVS